MSIQDQLQIVEDNLNEYGQCNITLKEFNYLKEQIRADAIEEYRVELHEKYTHNKYLYESNIEHWNLDMEEVDEIAAQLIWNS